MKLRIIKVGPMDFKLEEATPGNFTLNSKLLDLDVSLLERFDYVLNEYWSIMNVLDDLYREG